MSLTIMCWIWPWRLTAKTINPPRLKKIKDIKSTSVLNVDIDSNECFFTSFKQSATIILALIVTILWFMLRGNTAKATYDLYTN